MKSHHVVEMPLADLAAGRAGYNPRQISRAAKERLRSSLETFGLVSPLIWNTRTGTLVSGHQRLDLLEEAGIERVQVVQVDLDPSQEKSLNITMNRQDFGQFDRERLDEVLRELSQDGADLLESLHLDELPEFRSSDGLLEKILSETEHHPQANDPDPQELAQALADKVRALPPARLRQALLVAVPLNGRGSVFVLADPDHQDFVDEIRRAHDAGQGPLERLFDAIV